MTSTQKTERVVIEALTSIPEKKTVYVSLGEPPGDDPDYAAHLLDVISSELYGIDDGAPAGVCPVCGRTAPLGASALKGAKVELPQHGQPTGSFPTSTSIARRTGSRCARRAPARWRARTSTSSRICSASHHRGRVPPWVLPYVVAPALPQATRRVSAQDVLVKKARAGKATDAAEGDLLVYLAEESSLASFHVLWATAGDSLGDVTGFITDVPSTRLGKLSSINKDANAWSGGVLPARRVRPLDLRLSLVGELL